MEAIREQVKRISRCHAYVARHNPAVEMETVARTWIRRYARRWRARWGSVCEHDAEGVADVCRGCP